MDELNCKSVRESLWDFMTENLHGEEREGVTRHLEACRDCDLHRAEVRSLRMGFKGLPRRQVSPLLATRLRVIASRERSRQTMRRDLAARMAELRSSLRLIFDNLLRPIAVPAAGGILASLFCFGVIVGSLHMRPDWGSAWDNDIPIGLYTNVILDDVTPFSVAGKDVMVQLTVDPTGKVSDFTVPSGDASSDEMREIGNLVLYSTFIPATAFGQRVSGKILVGINHINVRD
jgi:hypothetical protein